MDTRVRFFTGPTAVDYFAKRAAELGYSDIIEGTEHIIFTVPNGLEKDSDTPHTDRLVFRQNVGEAIYGRPVTSAFRDVSILSGTDES